MAFLGFGKKPAAKAKDPVCGMDVDPTSSAFTAAHDDESFHFCSANCLGTFKADEHRYAHGTR